MSYRFRHSMCNEAFDGVPFADACRTIRRAGYTGLEIAPFTLAESPRSLAPGARREYRDTIRSEGLDFAGFHWLMAAPKGLHVTTPDAELRRRSWQLLLDLIDLAADLGDHAVLVFGSPRQRCATGGLTPQEATKNLIDGLASIAGHACSRRVSVLIEALSPDQCDVVQTLADAVEVVRQVGSPAVQTMFDVHNAVAEKEAHAALVDRYYGYIRHVHLNELDGRHCGAGDYDYAPVLDVLRRRQYPGWISLEAFDFTPGAERLANESLRHLEKEIARLPL